MRCQVLSFIHDEKDTRKASSPYIGKRCYNKLLLFHHIIDSQKFGALMTELVLNNCKVIIKGLHIRLHFFLDIAGEEAKIAVCQGNYWPCQEYLFISFKLLKGSCKCQKSFSCTCFAGQGNQLDFRIQEGVEGK